MGTQAAKTLPVFLFFGKNRKFLFPMGKKSLFLLEKPDSVLLFVAHMCYTFYSCKARVSVKKVLLCLADYTT
jgi:hypothetical protein